MNDSFEQSATTPDSERLEELVGETQRVDSIEEGATVANTGKKTVEHDREEFGHFTLIRKIGKGGMGEVWKARHHTLGIDVALKFQLSGRSNRERQQFIQEAQAIASLDNHPRAAQIYEVGEIEGKQYIAQRLIKGVNLLEAAASAKVDRTLTNRRLLTWYNDTLQGLEAMHEAGLIHRDVKANNYMNSPFGAVLIDFGISTKLDQTRKRGTEPSGTLIYMSPEQARGDPLDHRTDIFSHGVMFHELFSDKDARAATSARDVWEEAKRGEITSVEERRRKNDWKHPLKLVRERYDAVTLKTLIDRAIKPEQEERWNTVSEMRKYIAQRDRRFKQIALAAVSVASLATLAYGNALAVVYPALEREAAERFALGNSLVEVGAPVAAGQYFEETKALLDKVVLNPLGGERRSILRGRALEGLGDAASGRGDEEEAKQQYRAAQKLLGERITVAEQQLLEAKIADESDETERAITIYEHLWTKSGEGSDTKLALRMAKLYWHLVQESGERRYETRMEEVLSSATSWIESQRPASGILNEEQVFDLAHLQYVEAWLLRHQGTEAQEKMERLQSQIPEEKRTVEEQRVIDEAQDMMRARYEAAGALYQRLLETVVEGRGDKLLGAVVKLSDGALRFHYPRLGESRSQLEEAIAAVEEWQHEVGTEKDTLPLVGPLAKAHDILGATLWGEGDVDEAYPHACRAVSILEQLGNTSDLARALYNKSNIEMTMGKLEEARSSAETGYRLSLTAESEYVQALHLTTLGELDQAEGDFYRCRETFQPSIGGIW
jgi:tetratricopeptide (TPR) repeat protein